MTRRSQNVRSHFRGVTGRRAWAKDIRDSGPSAYKGAEKKKTHVWKRPLREAPTDNLRCTTRAGMWGRREFSREKKADARRKILGGNTWVHLNGKRKRSKREKKIHALKRKKKNSNSGGVCHSKSPTSGNCHNKKIERDGLFLPSGDEPRLAPSKSWSLLFH